MRSARRERSGSSSTVSSSRSRPLRWWCSRPGCPRATTLNRSEAHFEHLLASETTTAGAYKGVTSGYRSVQVDEVVHPDLAWSYDVPTRQLLPIAGLVAF
jgi:uncharacterized protein (DUF427 family)